MNIMIRLDSALISKTIYQLLATSMYDVVDGGCPAENVAPDVLLVDISTLTHDLLARYPQAKAILIDDANMEPERLCATLLSYMMHGILSPHNGLQQVWVDNGSVEVSRYGTWAFPRQVTRDHPARVAQG